mmetsp:Transcript_25121/g.84672  ORF Transcript_25121/g.84672 Transcript_25121/m.84672 type:complete len:446 (+) Transcript_25121:833-2170(+)
MGQEPLELSFPPRSAFDAMQKTNVKTRDRFVRMLDGALAAAREACAGLAAAREARPVAAQTAARVAPAAPPQMPRDAAPPRKESARERKGRELRELLKRVSKLHSAHKTKEAEQLLESAAEGSDGSRSLAVKRAQQLRRELFTYGGLELTRSTLAEFLNLCEVKLLLPERTRKARQEMTDSKTARELLEAASSFLHGVLGSKGRRSDEDRNAFWASVVSLMPRDLVNKRKVAAAMRLLKVPYRVIKQATQLRGELEDRARGWRRITSSGHKDKVDGAIIAEAWHSELLSSEDNVHKTSYAVYCGDCEGDEQYDIHWRRAQHGSDKDALQAFKGSEFESRLRAATKTEKREDGVGGSLALLRRYKCVCIKQRKATDCDCTICTLADVLLRRWHRARHGWRTSWRKAADGSLYRPPPCTCFICSDTQRAALHFQASCTSRCRARCIT